jgi:hypothetical protein
MYINIQISTHFKCENLTLVRKDSSYTCLERIQIHRLTTEIRSALIQNGMGQILIRVIELEFCRLQALHPLAYFNFRCKPMHLSLCSKHTKAYNQLAYRFKK